MAEVESWAISLESKFWSWVVDRAATCALVSPGACAVDKWAICKVVRLDTWADVSAPICVLLKYPS